MLYRYANDGLCELINLQIVSFYCFMPTEYAEQHTSEGFTFKEVDVDEILVGAYADKLEKNVVDLLKHSIDRMPWRLYVHDEYPVGRPHANRKELLTDQPESTGPRASRRCWAMPRIP